MLESTRDSPELLSQIEDLRIELGFLKQLTGSLLERVHVVGSQLVTITDILEKAGGHRAPAEE